MKKAYLVLKNGRVFEGQAIGAEGIALGEMVFTTGVIGYLETLTDPCYAGQIVIQTFPLVGNYGVANEDAAGKTTVSGYVVREICDEPSNFRSDGTLDKYLKKNGVVGICGVDTREITSILRDEGVMSAMICTQLPDDKSVLDAYEISKKAVGLGVKSDLEIPAVSERKYNVAVIDMGAGVRLGNMLSACGCDVKVMPWNTAADDVLSGKFDGVAISEGPGDPAEYTECVAEIEKIIGEKPVLGIGMGHQLVAAAMGGSTYKLKYGHRGGNQPVRYADNGRTYITSQNHGYAVKLPDCAREIFVNINDGSCEGAYYPGKQLLTVQFMPDICAGPNDMSFVYTRFMDMMGGNSDAQR